MLSSKIRGREMTIAGKATREKERKGVSRERVLTGTRREDRNVVTRSGKRDSGQKLDAFGREWERERPGGHRGWS